MDQKELDKILELHKMWLNGGENGKRADLYDADLDFSCWPLWCGGLGVKIDDRIARQLIYHVCSAVVSSPEISDSIKSVMLSRPVLDIANKFHRVDECGELRR